jgi:hypothetical protein
MLLKVIESSPSRAALPKSSVLLRLLSSKARICYLLRVLGVGIGIGSSSGTQPAVIVPPQLDLSLLLGVIVEATVHVAMTGSW